MYNVNSHTSMLDGFYLTTQYQGECGHIEGHAYSVFFLKCFGMVMIAGQYNSVCMCSKVKARNI